LITNNILKDAKKLRALTSLLPEEFEALLVKFESKFEAYIEKYKLDGRIRYNTYSPRSEKGLASSAEKLLFILVYQKQNPIQEFLAFSFNLNQAMCAKWIKFLLPILEKSLHQ
jgi:Helix-turn-helix of DDE superfamily endonuclease